MGKPWENSAGYPDPTAYAALKAVENEEKRVSALVSVLKSIIRLAGFELVNRIELRDSRTGREYK